MVSLPPQGGYKGSEADISLTALVLIALNEGKELCSQKIPVGSQRGGRDPQGALTPAHGNSPASWPSGSLPSNSQTSFL